MFHLSPAGTNQPNLTRDLDSWLFMERAQHNRLLNSLAWEDVTTGTNPNLTWTSVVKMDGKVLGSGSGARKKQARGFAARQALVTLGIVDNIPPDG
ncbi:hypothetical protein FRC04_010616 [Tulasnella sp. 424]|nr:hypothetical protein FRC04_010616 [Tulasnella sp. 424]KAG8972437.1 hypothetical protein FRC05_010030 [Tulasnella sp. 425]